MKKYFLFTILIFLSLICASCACASSDIVDSHDISQSMNVYDDVVVDSQDLSMNVEGEDAVAIPATNDSVDLDEASNPKSSDDVVLNDNKNSKSNTLSVDALKANMASCKSNPLDDINVPFNPDSDQLKEVLNKIDEKNKAEFLSEIKSSMLKLYAQSDKGGNVFAEYVIDQQFLEDHYRELMDMDKMYCEFHQTYEAFLNKNQWLANSSTFGEVLKEDKYSFNELVYHCAMDFMFKDMKVYHNAENIEAKCLQMQKDYDLMVFMMCAVASRHHYVSDDYLSFESAFAYMHNVYNQFAYAHNELKSLLNPGGVTTKYSMSTESKTLHKSIWFQLVQYTPVDGFTDVFKLWDHIFGGEWNQYYDDFFCGWQGSGDTWK